MYQQLHLTQMRRLKNNHGVSRNYGNCRTVVRFRLSHGTLTYDVLRASKRLATGRGHLCPFLQLLTCLSCALTISVPLHATEAGCDLSLLSHTSPHAFTLFHLPGDISLYARSHTMDNFRKEFTASFFLSTSKLLIREFWQFPTVYGAGSDWCFTRALPVKYGKRLA